MTLDIQPYPELEFHGYSLAYFDTNIYRMLAGCPESWSPVRELLLDHNLVLGVSDANVLELSDVTEQHSDLARFLLGMPSALFKTTLQIMSEETQAYLEAEAVNPLLGPLCSLQFERDDPVAFTLERLFGDANVRAKRAEMTRNKPLFLKRIRDTYENFEPVVSEDYTEEDAPYYAFQQIYLQFLCTEWPECARAVHQEMRPVSEADPTVLSRLRGFWPFSLVQFYRYYLHDTRPHGNDYGDFLQVVPIAYCRLAVVENDLCNELNHMRRAGVALRHTEVRNVRWLRDLTGLRLA